MPRTSVKTIATIPCLICEADNSLKTALCNNCHAPMALVHQYAAQQREPCVVSIVGESNVGKTVYLGMLFIFAGFPVYIWLKRKQSREQPARTSPF